ncbi:GTP-binding protein Der [Streptobacillus moniliformis]|nr:GTP-binding protein Der [Streptobacillus moniliformis]
MADLVLLVLDSSKEIEEEDIRVIEKILELEKQYIVLLNKIDLERKLDISKYNLNNIVEISAQNNINMDKMEMKFMNLLQTTK